MAAVADQKSLHLMNGYLHGQIRLSFAGDSHTATSAFYLLDIAYGAEPEFVSMTRKSCHSIQQKKRPTPGRLLAWPDIRKQSVFRPTEDSLTQTQELYRHNVCFQLKHVALLNSAVPYPLSKV
jgi:hypothetical protein